MSTRGSNGEQPDGPVEKSGGLQRPGETHAGGAPSDHPIPPEPQELIDDSQPQDTLSTRAHNTRHGKVTADKWNQ